MGLFGKKKESLTPEQIAQKMSEEKAAQADSGEKKADFSTGNPKIDITLTKITAQIEGLSENRKIVSDRFSRIGEQIGELRGMIVDTNKTISTIEVSSTKAVDLVESVQPEKLMVEMRKTDGKIEALKANIEANESLMRDLMGEIKKMRTQMSFYKGVEQVIKLNEEIKKEIAEGKKVQAVIERHSDKVETIFLEISKKFAEFDKFASVIKDMQATFKVFQTDFDKIKIQIDLKEGKKEFANLLAKFNDFEKHIGNLIKILDEKTRIQKKELDDKFKRIVVQLEKKANTKLDLESVPEKRSILQKMGIMDKKPEKQEGEQDKKEQAEKTDTEKKQEEKQKT